MNFCKLMFENDSVNVADLTKVIKDFREEISKRVIGQEHVASAVAGGLFSAAVKRMSDTDGKGKGPLATFVFTGPSGMGKTLFAESMGEILGLPIERFDMSAYAGKDANIEFSGSDKVYSSGKEGNVTSYVRRNGSSILIFDEIEKAHPVVINLFLQILDKGVLRDSYNDKEISFRNTIVIFTTNAGKQLYTAHETDDLSVIPTKTVIKALERDIDPVTENPYFPAPICSRLASGTVVMFNCIDAFGLYKIASTQIENKCRELKSTLGIDVRVDPRVLSAFLLSEGGKADGRVISARASAFLNDEVYELLRLVNVEDIPKIKRLDIDVAFDNTPDDIRELFEEKGMDNIMLYASSEAYEVCKKATPYISYAVVKDVADAEKVLNEDGACAALIDLNNGIAESDEKILNIEDAQSVARDIMHHIRKVSPDMPIYVLDSRDDGIRSEEKASLYSNGVHGVISLDDSFSEGIGAITKRLHCIESMKSVAAANKIVTYETLQTISEDKSTAVIKVFDFKFEVALDPEDKDDVLNALFQPDVTFDCVIGADDAKNELKFFAEHINNRRKLKTYGVGSPRGILMYGPSGTGKTMLAKAMAKEAKAAFISIDANSLIDVNAARGIRRVHEIFAIARKYAPSIIFVDEFEAIAKERIGVRDGSEELLTAFLTEMDGFKTDRSKPVFVLAATNFGVKSGNPRSIDSAVLRRFDRNIYVGLPSCENRRLFLSRRIDKNKTLYSLSDEDISNIAARAVSMSLSELDGVLETALRSIARTGAKVVDYTVLDNAFETFTSGDRIKWDEEQLRRVAYHEAGHALISMLHGITPIYLSVAARDGRLGYMQCKDYESKVIHTKEDLRVAACVILGGRAAEMRCYGEDGYSTGATDDLRRATELMTKMLCSYGMYPTWGIAVTDESNKPDGFYDKLNGIIQEALSYDMNLIGENEKKLQALAEALINKNCLCESEIRNILEG